MSTKQLLACGSPGDMPTAAAGYLPALFGLTASAYQSSITNHNGNIAPTSGTLSKLSVRTSDDPGVDKSWTFTLYKNGSPTTLTVTISGASTTGQDTVHSVSISASDILHMEVSPSNSPESTTMCQWTMEFVPDTDGEYIFGGNTNNSILGSNYYLFYGAANPTTTENNARFVCPLNGTVKKLAFLVQTAPGSGKNDLLTARKNTSAQTLVADIADTAVSAIDTTHSFSVSAGDFLSFITTIGAGIPRCAWSVVIVPDDTSYCFFPSTLTSTLSQGSTQYFNVNGILTTGTDSIIMDGFEPSGIHIALLAAPGAGKSRTFTYRKNADNSDISVTISGTDTSGTDTGSIEVADFDALDLKSEVSNTPAASIMTTALIYKMSSGAAPYDDGTPSGGIVFGGEVVEVGSSSYTDGTASGGIVFGGEEVSDIENHQVDGACSGGIVFGGEVAEQWLNAQNNYVAVKGGTYRISGTLYTLAETLTIVGLGSVAAIVDCGSPPAGAGDFRYDLLSIDTAGVITVTAGAEAATPVMPSTPSGEIKLDHVLRYYGQTTIIQADIGKLWSAPVLTTLTASVDDDELAWAETDTDIDITCRDQYGQLYTGSKVINASITTGNGTVSPASKSGSASTFTFNYERDGEVTDVSPVITFSSPTGPFCTAFIRLLDVAGDLMT